jgi:MerR family transcriptional regulator, light-induced transcriptional regulator
MQNELLTVQEAAQICGVSSSTFKRMCESESIPLARTPGGHRRIERLDLERLTTKYMRARSGRVSSVPKAQLSVDQVIKDLMESNSLSLAQLFLRSTSGAHDLIAALEDFLIAALWKIGELWRAKKIDVYQEHYCTNTALTTLDILRQHVPVGHSNAYVAVGGSLSPSVESIPSKLVALCLQLVGYTAIDFGAMLPPESLAKAASDYGAELVWVTHTHVVDVDSLLESHHVLHNRVSETTKIVIGGGGISPALRRSLPWCQSYETLSQMARALAKSG